MLTFRRLSRILAVSAILLTSQGVFAQGQADTTAPAKQSVRLPLTGKVTDAATGKELNGIRVTVGVFSAAITDESGKFEISVPAYDVDVLIEGDGFAPRQVSLKGRKNITVALLAAGAPTFQDQVVMPTRTTSIRNLTGAVANFNTDGAWDRPGESADALLQGKATGLNSIRRSGTPGVGANLFLQGFNSLYATNKPLVVVDGIIYDINDYGESIIANNYTNPLALINVHDIDHITVLKDAASIYGTRGANGAILITTSRAKEQATRIDFAAYTGVNQPPRLLPVMDAASYRIYLGEILQTSGLSSADIAALPFMNDDPSSPDYYRYHNNTNWQKNVFDRSINNNYFLKVTGGDNIATYGLSVGFTKNGGIVKTTDLTRYNTRFNAAFNFSKKFTGEANLAFTYNEQNLKDQGIAEKTAPIYLALTKAPFLTPYELNDKGIASPNLEDADILGVSNPSVLIDKMQAFNKYYRFNGSFKFNYQISQHFNAATLFGVVYDKVRENIFVPRRGVADDTLSNAVADSRLGSQVKRLFSIFSDSRLEFTKQIGRTHSFHSQLGLRYQKSNAEQDFALGFNSATDELVSVQNGSNALRRIGGGIGEWNWMNTYFSFDYGFKERFFVSVNAAMDGSSRFGPQAKDGITISDNKFAIMPSVGLAWLVSSQPFMAKSSIDLLKFRATYGLSGNDDIGNYTARQTYTSQNLLGMQGLVRSGIPNPAIQWETVKKLNAGMDLAFWNERVSLSADVFNSKTTNMLVYRDLAGATGFTSVITNDGAMKNTGFDLGLYVRAVHQKDLKLDLGLNVSRYKNTVESVPDGMFTTQYAGATILTREGGAANLFYGYTSLGVFSTAAEAAAAGLQMKNADGSFSAFSAGDIHFADLNNDQIIDENDRSVIGNPNPDFFGSFSGILSYKHFELNTFFTFVSGNDIYNHLRHRLEAGSGFENQLNSVINRWRAEGQVTDVPRVVYGDPLGNSRFSNRWIEDGSYFRLRTITLSYNLQLPQQGAVKYATIYATANNLLTSTKYMGYDPEFSASPSVFAQGIDTGLDPQFKSLTLGVKVGF